MKMGQAVRVVATAVFLLLLLAGMVTGAFFLTALLYHTIGHAPPPFLLAVGFFAWINSRPKASRRWLGLFEPILQALEQIAKGDFQVRLHYPKRANPVVSELAN